MKKQYHIIKMTFMFLLILSVMIVFVNCGKSNKSSDISLSLKAPSYVSTGSYTVTAAAYDKNGTLLGNQVSATITNMEGSLSLTGIPAQSDVSIAVSVKQLNSDTILIRGSKIVNISEGINTVDLTLGLHQLNLSGKYQEITDISSFDNFSVVLWHTWSDTSTYYAEKTKYASKFDEIKGVFTGHYSYATDTNYNEYYSMETAVDSAGNIIIVRKPGSENRIEIYAIPANFSSAVLLCDTTSTDFSNQNYYLLTDKNQNIILTFYYSSLFKQYNLVYNSSSLSANSAVLRYYNSFENSYASESSHSLKYDSNNRLHLTYYYPSSSMNSSSPVEYKWEYSDNYGSSFSQPKTFYSYPGYYPSTVYGSAYIHNFGALIDGALITLKHTSYDDTTCLFYSRILSSGSTPESQLFFTNVATPPTQFNSYYSELKSGNNGKYLFFNLMNKTNNIPYLIIFQDKGDTWSVPIKLFDTAPANYYNNIWDANNYSAKFVMIGKQTCSSQQPAPIKNSITRSPKYSYGYGTILENIYISEQFGSGYFTQASVSTPSSSSNLPPNIYLDSLTGETKGIDQTITCLATDTDGTVSMVYLYYKKNSDKNYTFATINSEISYPSSYHYTISGSFTFTA
ncbi:hypothetical protein KA977_14760, partial [Candidatus Dependentiae bacterium]|nr:hypothetical protein [Candidatus Dependentiae bacterium]